jgi:hypothetical protein
VPGAAGFHNSAADDHVPGGQRSSSDPLHDAHGSLFSVRVYGRSIRKFHGVIVFLLDRAAVVTIHHSGREKQQVNLFNGGRSYLNNLGPLSEKEQAVIGPIAVEQVPINFRVQARLMDRRLAG